MVLTKYKIIILTFYITKWCLYIREKKCILHEFSSFEKQRKTCKEKL
jgi:hypothetical protein